MKSVVLASSTKVERQTRPCPICGRQIFWDHGLNRHNFDEHVTACPRQMARIEAARRRKASAEKRRREKAFAHARATGVGSGVPPTAGQLGLPFDGVPDEVTGEDE